MNKIMHHSRLTILWKFCIAQNKFYLLYLQSFNYIYPCENTVFLTGNPSRVLYYHFFFCEKKYILKNILTIPNTNYGILGLTDSLLSSTVRHNIYPHQSTHRLISQNYPRMVTIIQCMKVMVGCRKKWILDLYTT